MSDRERWIIYPLLFLSLGVALRDKFTREIETNQIVCRRSLEAEQIVCDNLIVRKQWAVVDQNKRPMMVASVEQGQEADGQPKQFGTIRLLGNDGKPVAQLAPVSTCQALVIVGDRGQPMLALGSETQAGAAGAVPVGIIKSYDAEGRTHGQLGPVVLCNELHILNPVSGGRLVSAGGVPVKGSSGAGTALAGRVTVQGPQNQPLVALGSDDSAVGGVVTTQSHGGRSQVVMRSGPMGGLVTIVDAAEQLTLALGHFDRESGLAAVTRLGNSLAWLPFVQRTGMPPEPKEHDEPARQTKPAASAEKPQ